MSIKLLSQRSAFPEIGQIRLGRQVGIGQGKSRPEMLDHFEILARDAAGEWVRDQTMHAKVGATPRALDVYIAADDPDTAFHSDLSLYRSRSRGRYCTGDGEVATVTIFPGDRVGLEGDVLTVFRQIKGAEGAPPRYEIETERLRGSVTADTIAAAMHEIGPAPKRPGMMCWEAMKAVTLGSISCDCPLLRKETDARKRCKPHGILRVILAAAGSLGGYWVLRTTSWNSIRRIEQSLLTFRERLGFLWGLKLRLVCSPMTVLMDDGKRQRVFVAHLELPLEPNQTLLQQAHKLALERQGIEDAKRLLPGAKQWMETLKNEQELIEEFHPEVEEHAVAADVETGEVITAPAAVAEEPPPPDGENGSEPAAEEAATLEGTVVKPATTDLFDL